ncbi:MAG TPA: hypothetical protein VFZ59_18880 [Verrucomicrobiae bacterium]|nr:hypothetical protein [Verrucomicrobiae bacterium]
MNTPPLPPVIRLRANRQWLWLILAIILLPLIPLGGLALGVASYFHLSSDTRALRNELTRASGAEWQKQIGLNIGDTTLGLARGASLFIDLDSEAQAALRTVRGVEVGIYELDSTSKAPDCAAMLNAADKAMSKRGWERVVGVISGKQMVGVFLPAKITSANRTKCCVAVLDDRKLIVVSAQADLQPLVELVQSQSDWRAKFPPLARR